MTIQPLLVSSCVLSIIATVNAAGAVGAEKDAIQRIKDLGGEIVTSATIAGAPVIEVNLAELNARFDDDDLELLRQFSQIKKLEVGYPFLSGFIRIRNQRLTNHGLTHIGALSKLENLSVQSKAVTDDGLKSLIGLSQLKFLKLQCPQITDRGLTHIKQLRNLEALHLIGAEVTDEGVGQILSPNLSSLCLDGTKITDRILPRISALPKLSILSLSKTAVTDSGLAPLKNLTSLERLFLDETGITDSGLAHLKGLGKLTDLFLGKTKISQDGLLQIRKALPNAKVNY